MLRRVPPTLHHLSEHRASHRAHTRCAMDDSVIMPVEMQVTTHSGCPRATSCAAVFGVSLPTSRRLCMQQSACMKLIEAAQGSKTTPVLQPSGCRYREVELPGAPPDVHSPERARSCRTATPEKPHAGPGCPEQPAATQAPLIHCLTELGRHRVSCAHCGNMWACI